MKLLLKELQYLLEMNRLTSLVFLHLGVILYSISDSLKVLLNYKLLKKNKLLLLSNHMSEKQKFDDILIKKYGNFKEIDLSSGLIVKE